MGDLNITKISLKLSLNNQVVKNWRLLYDSLELPSVEADSLAQRKSTNSITHYELISEILRLWKSAKGIHATSQNLEIVLRDLDLNSAAVQVSALQDNSNSLDTVPHLKFPLQHNYQGLVAKYVTRLDLEQQIMTNLTSNVNQGFPIDFPVVVLQGIGGVGKSTLAKKICQLAKEGKFNGNFIWIDAEMEHQILNGFANLFGNKNSENKDKGHILSNLKEYYSTQLIDKECLLIFDNVDNYQMVLEYLPLNLGSKLSVLITSNVGWDACDYGNIKIIPISYFTTQEFSDFVKKIISHVTDVEIEAISEYTGRIPHLSNIVCFGLAKWRNRRPKLDIKEYFVLNDDQLLIGSVGLEFNLMYKRSTEEIVERQIKLMLKYEGQDGMVAYNIICLLAYCKPSLLEEELLSFLQKHKDFESSSDSDLEAAITVLVEQGFLERIQELIYFGLDSENIELSIHRSHQLAIRNILRKEKKENIKITKILDTKINYSQISKYCIGSYFLNLALLWDLGKKYGDSMLKNMINSKYFLPCLIKSNIEECVITLATYAKKSKTKEEYARWLLFGKHELFIIKLELSRKYFEMLVDNFNELFVVMKSYNRKNKEEKLTDFMSNIAYRNVSWVYTLLENFPDLINVKVGNDNQSLLHVAAKEWNLSDVNYFINKGLDLNAVNKFGETPLFIASKLGRLEIVDALLLAGADINIQNNYKSSPIHEAVRYQNSKMLKKLFQAGANINVQDKVGSSPLHKALEYENSEMLEKLLQTGANVIIRDIVKSSPLHKAFKCKNSEILEKLLQAGANINVQDNVGYSPLHTAVISENSEILDKILKAGANINILDNYGSSPLHEAIRYQRLKTAERLLQAGADPNFQNKNGRTPLHDCPTVKIAQLLISYNANPNIKDTGSETALDIAKRKSNEEMVKLLTN